MSFRLFIYNALVNKQPGISYRYHKIHDKSHGLLKIWSWIYLLILNFGYYILQLKYIGKNPKAEYYESKRLPVGKTESSIALKDKDYRSVKEMTEELLKYDVISFDMFDTLIFRPLSEPADVFFFVGEELGIPDFKSIRRKASASARHKKLLECGHTEVTLKEIWDEFEKITGTDSETGMRAELEAEKKLCYANPFMLEVWNAVKEKKKRIIVVSDMYVSSKDLGDILSSNGFTGAEKIYVSCEHGRNKAKGDLFELVKKDLGDASVVHVGDNEISDGVNAKKNGFVICRYPQVRRNMLLYRPFDMSSITGSAYRGIVSNHIYNGLSKFSKEYEFGFIYGGLFVLGYCNFIHEQAVKTKADKLFFLSRDGETLKKVYDSLFPSENTEYVYWSRRAALLLTADDNRYDYFRRFIFHKVNRGYSIDAILGSMDLGFLAEKIDSWKGIWEKTRESDDNKFIELKKSDELTDENASCLKRFIEYYWDEVMASYAPGNETAKKYFEEKKGDAKKILAIDIGWAGSGALSLSYLMERKWKMVCTVTGIVAGTNTIHNPEPDASESFIQSGKLISYMYSQRHNRDLLKMHDPNKDHNIYWELLLSSPEPAFAGFYADGLRYGKQDVSPDAANEIRKGITCFVNEYSERFKEYPFMFNISGRDAYAPMIIAMSRGGKYLKALAGKTGFEKNVV